MKNLILEEKAEQKFRNTRMHILDFQDIQQIGYFEIKLTFVYKITAVFVAKF